MPLAITFWEGLFLLCALCVAHAYVVYPASIAVLAMFRSRPVRKTGPYEGTYTIVLPARNEQHDVVRRMRGLTALIDASELDGELIVVVNGSTDGTASEARSVAGPRVHVLEITESVGKAQAMALAATRARGDVLVFADVRQRWAADALECLLSNFTDPDVGAASGDLELESDDGVIEGVGTYWRFEKWLRRKESAVGSIVGVTGSISAVRRTLFRPPPRGTVLDDVYWPLRVVMAGYRVVHDTTAKAFDRLPPRPKQEFWRKVRTLGGNLQLVARMPEALIPWRNPVWYQYVSHKVLRLVAPWALIGLLALSLVLPGRTFAMLATIQIAFYLLGILGIVLGPRARTRVLSAAGSFVLLNAAALLAFGVWMSGGVERSWQKTEYGIGNPENT